MANGHMDGTDRRILDRLQQELPLTHRPYRQVAEELGLDEADVLGRVTRLREEGIIRRLGPILDQDVLGRSTTLAVVRVPPERVDDVGAIVSQHPRVTHNYLREGKGTRIPYNLWFTFTAATDEKLAQGLRGMSQQVGLPIYSLRARRKFKVGVRFPILEEGDLEGEAGS